MIIDLVMKCEEIEKVTDKCKEILIQSKSSKIPIEGLLIHQLNFPRRFIEMFGLPLNFQFLGVSVVFIFSNFIVLYQFELTLEMKTIDQLISEINDNKN